MKSSSHFLPAVLLILSNSVFAQDLKPVYPFAQGNWGFDLNRVGAYNKYNFYRDDLKIREETNGDLNLQGMYFVMRNLGLGLNYSSSWFCDEQSTSHSQDLGLKFQYGASISANSYLYGRIGVGLGWEKDIDRIAGNDNNVENKNDYYNLNAAVGLPFRFKQGGLTYLTPELSWDRNTWDFDGGKQVENSYGINLKLQTYMGPNDFNCKKKIDFSTIHSRYDQGSQFIDFNSSGFFGSSKNKTTYDAVPITNEFKLTGGDVMLHYGRYLIDNVALGAGVGFNTSKEKQGNSEYTTTGWSLIPRATLNLPAKNCWNNLFLELEGGVGSTKFKSDVGTGTNTNKLDFTTYGGSLGFNYHLSSEVALTPKLGYTFENIESSGSNVEIKSRGPEARLGLRFVF